MRLRRLVLVGLALYAAGFALDARAGDPEKARRKLEKARKEFTPKGFMTEIFFGHTKEVLLYLEAGMSPNTRDEHGYTALDRAMHKPEGEIAAALIRAGADVNAVSEGITPLCQAAFEETEKNIKALIEAGAKLDADCGEGASPLHVAVERESAPAVTALLAANADVNARDNLGCTPLHETVRHRSADCVALLIAAKPDLNAICQGDTTIRSAVEQDNAVVVQALVNAGADLDARGSVGRTLLHEAAMFGYEDVVRILLDAGMSPRTGDSDHRTALDLAVESLSPDAPRVVQLLREAMNPATSTTNPDPVKNCLDSLEGGRYTNLDTMDALPDDIRKTILQKTESPDDARCDVSGIANANQGYLSTDQIMCGTPQRRLVIGGLRDEAYQTPKAGSSAPAWKMGFIVYDHGGIAWHHHAVVFVAVSGRYQICYAAGYAEAVYPRANSEGFILGADLKRFMEFVLGPPAERNRVRTVDHDF